METGRAAYITVDRGRGGDGSIYAERKSPPSFLLGHAGRPGSMARVLAGEGFDAA
jgi:hypothetical protein